MGNAVSSSSSKPDKPVALEDVPEQFKTQYDFAVALLEVYDIKREAGDPYDGVSYTAFQMKDYEILHNILHGVDPLGPLAPDYNLNHYLAKKSALALRCRMYKALADEVVFEPPYYTHPTIKTRKEINEYIKDMPARLHRRYADFFRQPYNGDLELLMRYDLKYPGSGIEEAKEKRKQEMVRKVEEERPIVQARNQRRRTTRNSRSRGGSED